MIKLAELYMRLNVSSSDERRDQIANAFQDVVAGMDLGFFGSEAELRVRFEEGTLKTWLAVGGYLFGIYGGVASYNDFKQSLPELIKDSRTAMESIGEAVLAATKVSKDKVLRLERRKGMPGRISRLILRVEAWQTLQSNSLANSAEAELIRQEVRKILSILESQNDRALLLEFLPEPLSKSLPIQYPLDTDLVSLRYAVRREDNDDRLIRIVRSNAPTEPPVVEISNSKLLDGPRITRKERPKVK